MSVRYDVLALDIDGTILDASGRISPRLDAALSRVRREGARVVLCTGRPWLATCPLVDHLHLSTPPVVFDGALVPSLDGGPPLVSQPLPDETIRRLQDVSGGPDYLEMHVAAGWYVNHVGMEGEFQRRKLGIEPIVGPLRKMPADQPVLKAQFVFRGQGARERVVALGEELFPSAALSWGVSPGYDGWFVNVVRSGVDKATSLHVLLAYLGVPWSRVFAAGDSPSDLGHILRAGYGMAMGNAPHSVRRDAPHVAPSVEEDGLAKIIEDVVLDGGY